MRNRLIILAFLASFVAQAQVSEGGLPPSFQPEFQSFLTGKMPAAQAIPSLDREKAFKEDSQSPGQNRFAAPVAVSISLENHGVWQNLPNGDRVWLCVLRSPGAKGMTLIFDQFQLPPGARFFAYGANQQFLGAYTAQSCLPSGQFLIGVLKGETAYLELYEPASAIGQSTISSKRIDIAYDEHGMNGAKDFGNSLACNVNINCPDGSNWQMEKKGVARILMVFGSGEAWCSGTLIANTANTFVPYFLTAHHCQILLPNPEFSIWRFDFDYESANCSNPATEPVPHSVLGSERIAYRAETDFMLLKLNPIPPSYEVYFNGWNRDDAQTIIAPNSTYIHHPQGDTKKIAIDNQNVTIHPSPLNWGGQYGTSPANTHWKSDPDIGIYQAGSSGSPMFDANKRIVGQLHGGAWDTLNPCNIYSAFFGRFNISWNQGPAADRRLKEWLDPGNTGVLTQNGYLRPAVLNYTISGYVKNHWGIAMEEILVTLEGSASRTALTNAQGYFEFTNVPAAGNYTLKATHDSNDLNGVTTYDLVLISKHILALEPFDSPWKMIAADVNQSNSITTFDIVDTRKVILGINPGFPGTTSWRFLPADTAFGNQSNPFQGGLPTDVITINNLQANYTTADFKGVKMGDVNNTAVGN